MGGASFLVARRVVRVVEDTYVFGQSCREQVLHPFVERAGVANGRSFLYARGKGNGVGAALHEHFGPQYGFLAGAAAAVGEAYDCNFPVCAFERAFFVSYGIEAAAAGAEVLGLETSYYS